MKLQTLISLLIEVAEKSPVDAAEANVLLANSSVCPGFDIASIYEGHPGEIWIDITDEDDEEATPEQTAEAKRLGIWKPGDGPA